MLNFYISIIDDTTERDIRMLSPIEQLAIAVLIFIVMLGMGATIRVADFKESLNHPKPILIGVFSQFGWMPLIAFCLGLYLGLPNEQALALILLGTAPGGTTSNVFSYYANGDVSQSIVMTAVSTIGAVVMMPVLLALYGSSFTTDEFTIPYLNIVVSLIAVLIPVVIGMVLLKKKPVWAARFENLASKAGSIGFLLIIISFSIHNYELILTISPNVLYATTLLGLIGMACGYFVSKAAKLSEGRCRTVLFETGLQNTTLVMAIIALSFSATAQGSMLLIPNLYGCIVLMMAYLVTILFKVLDARSEKFSTSVKSALVN
jgi:BASS family bile acid:Na+ symporter